MPIYGYHCDQCGHETEVLQSMSDPPLKVCPNCMGPLRKMIYPAGIIFKGSGYYTTDYKAAGSPSRHGDSDGGSAKKSGEGVTSSEAKTESKTETKSESPDGSTSQPKSAAKETAKPAPTPKTASKDGVS